MTPAQGPLRVYLTTRGGGKALCWDYAGEGCWPCAPDERLVQFEPGGAPAGVGARLLREYTHVVPRRPGDGFAENVARLRQFCAALMALEDLEFAARASGRPALVAQSRALRKHLYVSEMPGSAQGVTPESAARQFEANEARMAAELEGPYGRRSSGSGNG